MLATRWTDRRDRDVPSVPLNATFKRLRASEEIGRRRVDARRAPVCLAGSRGVCAMLGFPLSHVTPMTAIRWLAALPFLGMLIGPFFVNRVQPLVLGMPLLLAWLVMWVVLASAIMAVIYAFDPANRDKAKTGGEE